MDKRIASLNIAHYREKFATEQDETKRQILLRLLAEEETKLATLDDPPKKEKAPELVWVPPFPPVGRAKVDPFLGFRPDPAAEDAAAWKG